MSTSNTSEGEQTSLSFQSITDGFSSRDIPKVKFIEDIDAFSQSFDPPASAELMIGAFSDFFGKLKGVEGTLAQRAKLIQSKLPEIEKSLKLVKFLKSKESASQTTITTRYNLADLLYAKATVDCASGIVNLWLGANVMLEYTYDEAIELLGTKLEKARQDLEETKEDLALVRNQIITSEVNISRIYNWDVRKKREEKMKEK
mmetsp:Transcript_4315/g.8272  ORF Transcript_4315/g.8272 Transcript_4315/m.8272 type:complete len:202 (+) Transcript_4315:69-674(+)|eukprot:CAMPEP_0176495160 /NCGR_PEP_ID=MMETSP0200_2-20121128/10500_1 /TAXON_ID=947934 /ORGANISM="Chaetoceros sp., Strain GSL56" /LENGTH=201 /DNA_ID=CAMNT_0017893003 /DNA_START=64 /DNA_END=669 /DNA_ORIENTATION=+